ncbi:hypothetical protein MuYL_1005 [Mucilaginibacter xinganensis]|uniref:Uncharacterized protein n=1 Tax=Mucilaginibacter xinganensis TaxID=1234841 RepID=A0A223NSM2_9SPHI|nr:hypothetical protein MuYL_1005 [Mucilaginibacter xinganensis]
MGLVPFVFCPKQGETNRTPSFLNPLPIGWQPDVFTDS